MLGARPGRKVDYIIYMPDRAQGGLVAPDQHRGGNQRVLYLSSDCN
jgi:hypothetical protein